MTQNIPQKTKLIMVILALFMPAFLVLPLVIWGGDTTPPTINKDLQAVRLAPVGELTVGKPATDAAVAAADSAPAFDAAGTYKTVCSACHDNLPNAPKPSDTAGWQARLDKAGSLDALVKSGIQGTAGGMPPKGGSTLDDTQFHDMVIYMLDHAKVAHGAAPADNAAAPADNAAASADNTAAPADNAAAPADNAAAPADSAAAPADNAAAPAPADSAPAVAAAPAFDAAGTYKASCAACHDNLPNAPKPSDTAAWQARLDKAGSLDALVKNGIQGTAGGMPPKGGSALDDAQFHDMVVYMLDHAKVAH